MTRKARKTSNSQQQICACSVFAVFNLCTLHGSAIASDKDAITIDWPDFVDSSNVVGKGCFLFETSFAFNKSYRYGIREKIRSTPFLLRFGIYEDFELGIEVGRFMSLKYTDRNRKIGQSIKDFSDTSIGPKWHVADAEGKAPSVGVLVHAEFTRQAVPFVVKGFAAHFL